ncbi:cobalamin-independent methionine synthase II family protein [Actinomycetospora lutea]|uniref:cobalamin-independent methionine synthase II family protein n=1 Tax=Actinomycetospora lutea TaxID=663604 RepID=UPI002365ADEA|nr:cobalamin-independent methionine synthase II family protein [Actinomycetospora lutea]MDD7939144.1 cobalamin-independent methionine synthase II family protein [Actinomycetospora lutea]
MTRIRTTHVGSLVRTPELVEVVRAREYGEPVDPDRHAAVLTAAVAEVVRRQVEIGLDVVSDGEYGKSDSWSRYIRERLGGFTATAAADPTGGRSNVPPGTDKHLFGEFYAEYEAGQGFVGGGGEWRATGPVHYTGADAVGRDIANLTAALQGTPAEGFLPVVAPASAVPRPTHDHYATDEELLFAVADALNEEYRAVVDAGLVVQIDDAHFAIAYDTMRGDLAAYRPWAELRTEALVRALDGIPAERARYHVCWGSWNAPHVGDVPLRDIVDLILRVPVRTYSLEQASPRHEHEWRVWEDVALPDDKVLMPGLISHATNVVEHPELVAERIVRLARLVGPERVVASSDCGFAQGPLVRRVHPSIQWAKLEALVAGARLAEQRL